MKLPIIVPRWSRVTLGMPRGPETRATMPYGLLVDLQGPARAGGSPSDRRCGWYSNIESIKKSWEKLIF